MENDKENITILIISGRVKALPERSLGDAYETDKKIYGLVSGKQR